MGGDSLPLRSLERLIHQFNVLEPSRIVHALKSLPEAEKNLLLCFNPSYPGINEILISMASWPLDHLTVIASGNILCAQLEQNSRHTYCCAVVIKLSMSSHTTVYVGSRGVFNPQPQISSCMIKRQGAMAVEIAARSPIR